MKRNWFRGIIGGLSFTSALFIFQACYGMPQDMMDDLLVEGKVTSKSTGLPIEGIRVTDKDHGQYQFTDDEGGFSFYTTFSDRITLLFEDVDSESNGSFANRDTVIDDHDQQLFVDIAMEDK